MFASPRAAALLVLGLTMSQPGCSLLGSPSPKPAATPAFEMTPVPTVPPRTKAPTVPVATATPLPTRPVGNPEVKAKPGQRIGPVITYVGAARADGLPVEPISVDKRGIPTYNSAVGSGFILVIEAKAGIGGHEVGRRTFVHKQDDPTLRPDLEIQANRDLGNGSPEVCDRRKPKLGGVPGIWPPTFDGGQKVADALNDLSCRFETFTESEFSCTVNDLGNYSYVKQDTTNQYCVIVAKSFAFPEGLTELRIRLRDIKGNPGPTKILRIKRPKQ